ncbi:MAG: ankyrin repeat domain-containing protein, partial [Akkermansia sp.]|nr:ankyrin repeat domain-containing protein [Akkermansia sp.]
MKSQDNSSQHHHDDTADCRNLQTTGSPHNKCKYFNGRYRWLTISAGALVLAPLFATAAWGASECSKQQMAAPATDEAVSDAFDPAADLYSQLLRETETDNNKNVAQRKLQEMGIEQAQYGEALLNAVKKRDTDTLSLLLTAGADVNTTDKNGIAPIHWAALGGYTDSLKLLLAIPGINLNSSDKNGFTPLHLAAYGGRTECVKLLLAAPGIDVSKPAKNGTPPLELATAKGHTECAQLIRQAGTTAPAINDKATAQKKLQEMGMEQGQYNEALRHAAYQGRADILRLILAAGADVNKVDEYGATPLIRAAVKGHPECVKLLLDAPGIDVNKANENGWSPLMETAKQGLSECMKLLLAAPGIDVNKANADGWSPLYLAA